MVCKNCGAEFRDDALQCPFCGCENTGLAEKLHKQQVGEVVAKIRNVREEAQKEGKKISSKASRAFIILLGVLLAVIVLGYIASEIVSAVKTGAERKREEAYLAELEAYYQKGDYDGLSECYRNSPNRVITVKSEKYNEVVFAWGYMKHIVDYTGYIRSGEYATTLTVYSILEDFNMLYRYADLKANDNTVYGNEKVLRDFAYEAERLIRETLDVTDEQIEAVKNMQLQYGYTDGTLQYMADEIWKRLDT